MTVEEFELTFDIESNEDDTEVALVVRSPSGEKITQHQFIVMVEQYLNDVTNAEIYRRQTGALDH